MVLVRSGGQRSAFRSEPDCQSQRHQQVFTVPEKMKESTTSGLSSKKTVGDLGRSRTKSKFALHSSKSKRKRIPSKHASLGFQTLCYEAGTGWNESSLLCSVQRIQKKFFFTQWCFCRVGREEGRASLQSNIPDGLARDAQSDALRTAFSHQWRSKTMTLHRFQSVLETYNLEVHLWSHSTFPKAEAQETLQKVDEGITKTETNPKDSIKLFFVFSIIITFKSVTIEMPIIQPLYHFFPKTPVCVTPQKFLCPPCLSLLVNKCEGLLSSNCVQHLPGFQTGERKTQF